MYVLSFFQRIGVSPSSEIVPPGVAVAEMIWSSALNGIRKYVPHESPCHSSWNSSVFAVVTNPLL